MGIGNHHSAKCGKDEWLTPPDLLSRLGKFDLDPCAPILRPWPTAENHYTINDNGLLLPWSGRIWCNPPYGDQAYYWLMKLAGHGNGMALIFARTETVWFKRAVWERADAVMFIEGRLFFHHVSGERAKSNSGAPSALIAYGTDNVRSLRESGVKGYIVELDKETKP